VHAWHVRDDHLKWNRYQQGTDKKERLVHYEVRRWAVEAVL